MHPFHANIDFSPFSDKVFTLSCDQVVNALTLNVLLFPGLPVAPAVVGGHLTTYKTIDGALIYPTKTKDLHDARLVLEDDMRQNGVSVNTTAKGDVALLGKSGFPISMVHAPVGPLAQAIIKSITPIPGGFEIELEKVPHALAYIVNVMPTLTIPPMDDKGHAVISKYAKWPWYNTSNTDLKITDLDASTKYTLVAVAIGSDPTLTFSPERTATTQ